MKQTLFEAEAVISVNTDKMFSDLDKAAREAKKRLQDALGGISVPTLGGRGGGSGGGGGRNRGGINLGHRSLGGASGNIGDVYGIETTMARGEMAANRFADAISRLDALRKNSILTTRQQEAAQNMYDAAVQKSLDHQKKIVDNQAKAEKQRIKETYRAGPSSRINPFGDEMAEIRLLRNTGKYEEALKRINTLLSWQLSSREKLSVLTLQQNVNDRASAFTMDSGGGVSPELRRRNAQVQNASFAIQDFVTVLSMGGGWSRAMASASNNLAFMTSMMGTVGGAAAGLAITLAAVLVPALIKAATGVSDMSEKSGEASNRINKLRQEIDEIIRSSERWAEINEKFESGDIEGLLQEEKRMFGEKTSLTQRLEYERGVSTAGRESAANDFEKSLGVFANRIPQEILKGIRSGEISANQIDVIKSQIPNWGIEATEGWFAGLKDSLDALKLRLEESDSGAEEAANKLNLLNHQMAVFGDALDNEIRSRLDKPLFAPGEMERAEAAQRQAEQGEKYIKGLEGKHKTIQDIVGLFRPETEESRIEEMFKPILDGMTIMSNGTELQNILSLKDAAIQSVKDREKPSISGTFAPTNFASQLTQQLLSKDPNKEILKLTKDQNTALDKLIGEDNAIVQELKRINTSAFSNN